LSPRRRVLVTGVAGFVGANLCRGFSARGWEVHGLLRATTDRWRLEGIDGVVQIHVADLRDREPLQSLLSSIDPEVIINAAAHSGYPGTEAVASILSNTVVSVANLLEGAEALNLTRFIHLGSSTEYGPKERPHREDDVLKPTTIRGATKVAASMLASVAGPRVTVLRLFSVFGPWEHPFRLIPTLIRAGLDDIEVPLTIPGFRRDLVFVDDVVEACLLAVECEDSGGMVFNIGSGRETANEETVAIVSKVLGKKIRVRPGAMDPRPTDCPHWCADITRARNILGWSPSHSLREGIEATVAWVKVGAGGTRKDCEHGM